MHLFLSYSRKDNPIAQGIAAALDALGIKTWLDTSQIEPGSPDWRRMIIEALKNSYAVAVLASPNCKASDYVPTELTLAESHQKKSCHCG